MQLLERSIWLEALQGLGHGLNVDAAWRACLMRSRPQSAKIKTVGARFRRAA